MIKIDTVFTPPPDPATRPQVTPLINWKVSSQNKSIGGVNAEYSIRNLQQEFITSGSLKYGKVENVSLPQLLTKLIF